jgi:hypothetical protein
LKHFGASRTKERPIRQSPGLLRYSTVCDGWRAGTTQLGNSSPKQLVRTDLMAKRGRCVEPVEREYLVGRPRLGVSNMHPYVKED